MGLNVFQELWLSYINAILENLQGKGNPLAIMDDLLIHSTNKAHKDRLK